MNKNVTMHYNITLLDCLYTKHIRVAVLLNVTMSKLDTCLCLVVLNNLLLQFRTNTRLVLTVHFRNPFRLLTLHNSDIFIGYCLYCRIINLPSWPCQPSSGLLDELLLLVLGPSSHLVHIPFGQYLSVPLPPEYLLVWLP